ncbi:MAG: hypothetical protein BGN84_14730 [Afipia sp. 62-7]|nr:YdcF family protein [Afipia sp.]OJU19507.1 MAG: hypothetical protein BGN84_14730 [Afipia sp. 62-7]
MFFYLSKIAGFFAIPSNAMVMLCVLGLLLLTSRYREAGARMIAAGVALLLIFGLSPASNLLLLPLSERFPAWSAAGRPPDGIIVLGGAIDPESSQARGSPELDSSGERMIAMLQLARRYPNARIVFSGGSAALVGEAVSEAPIVGDLLEDFGTARARIVLEGDSRTTAENATFTRQLVSPKPGERWLLVTSAFHMPRSVGAFRKAGFEVEAYPVDWRSRGWSDALSPFGAVSLGLARTDTAIHEWIGLIAYWATGRSSELFPGPRKAS